MNNIKETPKIKKIASFVSAGEISYIWNGKGLICYVHVNTYETVCVKRAQLYLNQRQPIQPFSRHKLSCQKTTQCFKTSQHIF